MEIGLRNRQIGELQNTLLETQESLSKCEKEYHNTLRYYLSLVFIYSNLQESQQELEMMRSDYERQIEEWEDMYEKECAETQSNVAMAFSICEQIQRRHVVAMEEMKEEYEGKLKSANKDYEALSQETKTLNEQLQKHEAMIVLGKAQLTRLQTMLNEANTQTATTKKEFEMVTAKNSQLTRELFLLRRVGKRLVIFIVGTWRKWKCSK